MRRAVMLVIVTMLVVAPRAFAHVTITPTHAEPGADVLLTFVVPNQEPEPITGVEIDVPRSFRVEGVSGPAGWKLVRQHGDPRAYPWIGGAIAPGRIALFMVSGNAPARRGSVTFPVAVTWSRGGYGTLGKYAPRLTVAPPAPPAPPAARDRRAHTLALAALVVAIAAAVVAVGTFFFVLALWLRGPEPLQEGKRERVVASRE